MERIQLETITDSEIQVQEDSETLLQMVVSEMEILKDLEIPILVDSEILLQAVGSVMEIPEDSDLEILVDSVILRLNKDLIINNHNQDTTTVVSDLMIQVVSDLVVVSIPAAVAADLEAAVHQVAAADSDPVVSDNFQLHKLLKK